jgi:hypothetical protein
LECNRKILNFKFKGQCLTKQTAGSPCSSYGVVSCMEWLNLTCSFGPMNNYLNCYCYSGYYWNSISGSCTIMGQYVGATCLGTYYNYACNTNASLTCSSSSSGTCQCIFIYLKHHLKYPYDLLGFLT